MALVSQGQLEKLIGGRLTAVRHESANQTWVGYGAPNRRPVFVKVFPKDRAAKFVTERLVTQQLGNRLQASYECSNADILVLSDCTPRDVVQITPVVAQAMGRCLAEFHQRIRPFPEIKQQRFDFDQAERAIQRLKKPQVQHQLTDLLRKFAPFRQQITREVAETPLVVTHGDVGQRNFKIVAGKLTLIDYERCKLGLPDQDFVKLFYQDFQCQRVLQRAFLTGYTAIRSRPQLTAKTQQFLIFLTAIGIFKYLDQFSDVAFERCVHRMLATLDP